MRGSIEGRVVSVQVGAIQKMQLNGKPTTTGIYKKPVDGPVRVQTLGLAGDHQADKRYHGGPKQAVYLYPSEHYPYWAEHVPGLEMPYGTLGENLTTAGVLEDNLRPGMRLRIGTALFEVTKRRTPCTKLATRLGTIEAIPLMRSSGRSGYYLAVIEEGVIEAGDPIREETA